MYIWLKENISSDPNRALKKNILNLIQKMKKNYPCLNSKKKN
jgi:hypothetical protein